VTCKKQGSTLLLVMIALTVMTTWACVMIHNARYAWQAASDRMVREQYLSIAEATLKYAIDWCKINRSFFAKRDGDEEVSTASWELLFGPVSLADKKRCSHVVVGIEGADIEEVKLQITLYQKERSIFATQCLLHGATEENTAFTLTEWCETIPS